MKLKVFAPALAALTIAFAAPAAQAGCDEIERVQLTFPITNDGSDAGKAFQTFIESIMTTKK